jgi:molybdopterin-guanine dinucleotide biosynthesis protein A
MGVSAGIGVGELPLPQKYNPTMLSIVVQAGGQSTRMGENKALKPFLGRPLIERVLQRLGPIADELFITTNESGTFDFLSVRQEQDVRPGFGPLGGLYTALTAAKYPSVGVVACDMPFTSAPLLVASAGILQQIDADVVIAESAEGFEPLHAVYRRAVCVPAIEAAMDARQLRVISWFPRVRVRRLTAAELARYDPDGLAFWNVNTPEEFALAEQRAGGR